MRGIWDKDKISGTSNEGAQPHEIRFADQSDSEFVDQTGSEFNQPRSERSWVATRRRRNGR
jgi:hypothetical protein